MVNENIRVFVLPKKKKKKKIYEFLIEIFSHVFFGEGGNLLRHFHFLPCKKEKLILQWPMEIGKLGIKKKLEKEI